MENTNIKSIDYNSMYLDLQCATWQLQNPTNSYEVNAAITSVMERMNELLDDPQYGHHAKTILQSVKKRLNGELPQTELAKHVQMITELIGYGEGYLPAPTVASEAIKKAQDKAKNFYTKATEAVPEDLTERLMNGAMGAYEQISAVVPESAKEKGRQFMGNVKDMLKNVVNGGSDDSTGEK